MVTVRSKALGDRRIVRLAQLAGYPGGDDEALGKMTRLWALCAEQQTNTPEVRHIRACLGPRGEEHLVESGLGDDKHRDPSLGDGVFRVRGCDETDWYFARLEQLANAEAGRARASLAQRDVAGRFRSGAPPGSFQHDSSDGPASDLLSGSDLPIPELPDPKKIVRAERVEVATGSHRVLRARMFNEAWTYAGLKHEELKVAGVDPHARNCWSHLPDVNAQESQDLLARITELAIGESPDWNRVRDVIRNRIDVAAAEARRDGTLRWFTPARMWAAKSFSIAKDLSPAQAAQPRGPKLAVEPPPVRKVKTL